MLSVIESKIQKYLLLLKSKGFAAYQGKPSFPVLLVVTTGPGRAKSLEERVIAAILQSKMLPQDVGRFLTVAVSDLKTLKGRSVLDPVWRPVPEGGPLMRNRPMHLCPVATICSIQPYGGLSQNHTGV